MGMFNTDKMYTFITGYASGADLEQTQKALTFAREQHKDQTRKGGEPYFVHPLTMACHAAAMRIKADDVIAAALLHDVPEDCNVLVKNLPVNDAVKNAVKLLTFVVEKHEDKEQAKKRYYNDIHSDKIAVLAKIIDRCHNVSTMAGVFSETKLRDYIQETNEYVLPLIRDAKELYPEYRDQLFILKYHIVSVMSAIQAGLDANSKNMNEMDIVVQFSKLWGIEIADSRLDKKKHDELEAYDSVELLGLLISWKNEYMNDENAEDTVEFFNYKLKDLLLNAIIGV